MEIYTKEEVIKLLKEQKEICAQAARINNNYGYHTGASGEYGSWGNKPYVDRNSIRNADFPDLKNL